MRTHARSENVADWPRRVETVHEASNRVAREPTVKRHHVGVVFLRPEANDGAAEQDVTADEAQSSSRGAVARPVIINVRFAAERQR